MDQRRSKWRTAAVAALITAGVLVSPAQAQHVAKDDGLALTPPMGFNNWNSTHCRDDFDEDMVKGIADIFVGRGLKDAGYEYVNIDDCWALPERDDKGDLVPDPARFPHGIKHLADYVHGKGLKFGIYTSAGTKTCASNGFPGGLGHEEQDARLFASWGVDYLKYDNCNNQGVDAKYRYTKMRDALEATGREIVFSICEWGENKPWEWARDVGHLWRTTGDISDDWGSMLSIAKRNMELDAHAGPGHWNDPDMLEVGNGGMTDVEYRSHFSLWSIMAAPLLIGADLREVTPETFEILENREVIAVNQDELGVQGKVIRDEGGVHVLVKPLSGGDKAVLLFNENDNPATTSVTAAELGLGKATGYRVRDLWAKTTTHSAGSLAAALPPHGSAMFRVSAANDWHRYPPAVATAASGELLYPGALPIAQPGRSVTYTTSVTNSGRLPVTLIQASLNVPAGWAVKATTPSFRAVLPGQKAFATTWQVTVPATAREGRVPVDARFTFHSPHENNPVTRHHSVEALVPGAAPQGENFVSDLRWLRSANGWGPVETDATNGETAAGDGGPITIRGKVFAKGLGTHAPARIEYYTGGACSKVTATIGIDDRKADPASLVSYEVWADGKLVHDSGPVAATDAARKLEADVSRATVVRLVVTDGGNGNAYDHADWGDLLITC
ncbi:NPCBM/NEW2 domain-containing protein [Lentzea sp.]|uniref:NPCBM/NEW2 domain-containing protein n=1 Tax=Lentzea sp. TaxID=56099 RepID=UPI002C67ACE3|nr:NPCBM/NEW2 domain-containing protein [Lentzea sp.]HUQ57722.1 NPCBM/NEW2 domain-containing protein [Lentzea sp.]